MRATQIKLQGILWPNGELSFGRVKETAINPFGAEMWGGQNAPPPVFCLAQYLDKIEGRFALGGESLGLSKVANSHSAAGSEIEESRKAIRGTKGLTRYGARMVRNSIHIIESSAPPFTISFATLTLPPMDESTKGRVMESWPDILRVFFQRLGRRLRTAGLPGEIAYVVELHPKRGEETGEPWPHIHAVFQGKRQRYEKAWALTPSEVGAIWADVINHYVDEASITWRKSHWNVQAVIRSASGYLSKYLSKGYSKSIMSDANAAEVWPIRSWWGATGGLKKKVKRACLRLGTEDCLMLVDTAKGQFRAMSFHYYHDVEVLTDSGPLWVGATAKCTDFFDQELRGYLRATRDFATAWDVPH